MSGTLYAFFFDVATPELVKAGVWNDDIQAYVVQLLADAARTERLLSPLQRVRKGDAGQGKQYAYVSDLMRDARGTDNPYHRLVLYRHLGDFALVMDGIFHEHVERRGLDGLYMSAGSHGYKHAASCLRRGPAADLYEKLAYKFPDCVQGLRRARERHMAFGEDDALNLTMRRLLGS